VPHSTCNNECFIVTEAVAFNVRFRSINDAAPHTNTLADITWYLVVQQFATKRYMYHWANCRCGGWSLNYINLCTPARPSGLHSRSVISEC